MYVTHYHPAFDPQRRLLSKELEGRKGKVRSVAGGLRSSNDDDDQENNIISESSLELLAAFGWNESSQRFVPPIGSPLPIFDTDGRNLASRDRNYGQRLSPFHTPQTSRPSSRRSRREREEEEKKKKKRNSLPKPRSAENLRNVSKTDQLYKNSRKREDVRIFNHYQNENTSFPINHSSQNSTTQDISNEKKQQQHQGSDFHPKRSTKPPHYLLTNYHNSTMTRRERRELNEINKSRFLSKVGGHSFDQRIEPNKPIQLTKNVSSTHHSTPELEILEIIRSVGGLNSQREGDDDDSNSYQLFSTCMLNASKAASYDRLFDMQSFLILSIGVNLFNSIQQDQLNKALGIKVIRSLLKFILEEDRFHLLSVILTILFNFGFSLHILSPSFVFLIDDFIRLYNFIY